MIVTVAVDGVSASEQLPDMLIISCALQVLTLNIDKIKGRFR